MEEAQLTLFLLFLLLTMFTLLVNSVFFASTLDMVSASLDILNNFCTIIIAIP